MAEFVCNLQLPQIKAEIAGFGNQARIVYSAQTTWWRHRIEPRFRPRGRADAIPVDPLGSPLFQIDGIGSCLAWIDAAQDNAHKYGKHGFTAFLAANAENCRDRPGGQGYSAFRTWDDANAAVDRFLRAAKNPPNGV